MNNIQITGLLLNLIIYILMLIPLIFLCFYKKNYKSKNSFILILLISFIIEIFFSVFLYNFSKNIFSIFTSTKGAINYAVYSSKILFISSSLYGIKILIPAYLLHNNMKKKSAILVLSKIAVSILFIFIGYIFFNFKGILFSIPLCDLLFYAIYIYVFLKIIR